MANRIVYQFLITLDELEPAIWRRIQVPEKYTFWDLHVAIQDSMGWLDYHLHAFRFGARNSRSGWEIGIPYDEGFDTVETLPGWEVPIIERFAKVGTRCTYEYDFGDGWAHEILLEGTMLAEQRQRYPKCIAGARACPPEDCGGVPGYSRLLEVIADPTDDEYEEMVTWLGERFESESFAPDEVTFDNPKKRWDLAFAGGP